MYLTMDLSNNEKIAILYSIKCMMAADGAVVSLEMDLINKICSMMHVGQNEFNQALEMSDETAMSILKDMSQDKRNLLAYLLQDMARVDGHIDERERLYFLKVNKELKFTNLDNI